MGFIDDYLGLVKQYWYVIAGFLLFFIIFKIIKRDKKPTFFDQIATNKEKSEEELMWNPTQLKYIKHLDKSYKVYGEIFCIFKKQEESKVKQRVWSEYDHMELRKKRMEDIQATIKKKEAKKIDAYRFLVRRKYLDLFLVKVFFGKKETLYVESGDFVYIRRDTIKLDDNMRFIWRQGFLTKMRPEFIEIVTDQTERLMKDHSINAMGQQQKDFSRVRTDWAHQMDMKETEIKADEKKEKAKKHG